jgi:hypothetical protein
MTISQRAMTQVLLGALVACSFCAPTRADEPETDTTLSGFLASTFRSVAGDAPSLYILPVPIQIPNHFFSPKDLPTELAFLKWKPVPAGRQISFDQASDLEVAIRAYSAGVVIGSPVLSPQQESDLAATTSLVRDQGGNPTAAYKKYQTYMEKAKSLRQKLDHATSAAEGASIQDDISSNDEQWTLFGNKAQIDAALAKMRQFTSTDALDLKTDWLESLKKPMLNYSQFFPSMAAHAGWVDKGISGTGLNGLRPSYSTSALAPPHSMGVVSAFYVSFVRVPVTNTYLAHPFLANNRWKHVSDKLLSSPSGTESVTSWMVTDVLVVKGLELTCSDVDLWAQFASASLAADEVSIDGFPIKQKGTLVARILPQTICWDRPQIVAVFATQLPTFPSPASNLKWTN